MSCWWFWGCGPQPPCSPLAWAHRPPSGPVCAGGSACRDLRVGGFGFSRAVSLGPGDKRPVRSPSALAEMAAGECPLRAVECIWENAVHRRMRVGFGSKLRTGKSTSESGFLIVNFLTAVFKCYGQKAGPESPRISHTTYHDTSVLNGRHVSCYGCSVWFGCFQNTIWRCPLTQLSGKLWGQPDIHKVPCITISFIAI